MDERNELRATQSSGHNTSMSSIWVRNLVPSPSGRKNLRLYKSGCFIQVAADLHVGSEKCQANTCTCHTPFRKGAPGAIKYRVPHLLSYALPRSSYVMQSCGRHPQGSDHKWPSSTGESEIALAAHESPLANHTFSSRQVLCNVDSSYTRSLGIPL